MKKDAGRRILCGNKGSPSQKGKDAGMALQGNRNGLAVDEEQDLQEPLSDDRRGPKNPFGLRHDRRGLFRYQPGEPRQGGGQGRHADTGHGAGVFGGPRPIRSRHGGSQGMDFRSQGVEKVRRQVRRVKGSRRLDGAHPL